MRCMRRRPPWSLTTAHSLRFRARELGRSLGVPALAVRAALAACVLVVQACAPRTHGTTATPPDGDGAIGTTTLVTAKAGPAHIGDSRATFSVVVPCSETRYVGLSPRTALTARFDAMGDGAKLIRVRAQLLDGRGQPVLEQRFDVGSTVGSFVLAVGSGAVVPDHVRGVQPPAEFLRLTVENPHCRAVRFRVQVD